MAKTNNTFELFTAYKDGQHGTRQLPNSEAKVSQLLTSGWQQYTVGHKSCLLHVNERETKKSKYALNTFFPKMVSLILGSSNHTDVC